MKATLTCRACGTTRTLIDEPRELRSFRCACGAQAEARASEDFASALEDALAQLWHLQKSFDVDVELSTRSIPEVFLPELRK